MQIEALLACLPKNPELEYETKGGKPGIKFKFEVSQYYVTLHVTGTEGQKLPVEVAAALGAWSLSVLAEDI